MMRFTPSILFACLALVAGGLRAEVIPVDVLVDFEAGNNGDALGTTYLDSVTRGAGVGAWTTAVATPTDTTVSTTGSASIHSPFWIRGTAYEAGSGDTRAAAILLASNDEAYWSLPFSATHDNVTVSFDFRFTGGTAGGDFDLFSIACASGQALVCHIDTNGTDDFTIHTGSPSDETGVGVDNDPAKTYRCTLRWRRNTDCHLMLYDRADNSLLGSATLAANDVAATGIRLGVDMHGVSSEGYLYVDNIAIDWTAAKYPLGPGGGDPLDAPYYVRGSDGSDTDDGLSLANAFDTIAHAETVVSPGDIIRVQAGTYEETVTIDVDGAATAPIFLVADGATIVRRFDVTGDYIELVGFEMTHATDWGGGLEPVRISSNTGAKVHDLNIHDTSNSGYSGGLTLGDVQSFVARGLTMTDLGNQHVGGSDTDKKAIGTRYLYDDSFDVLLEYITIEDVVEYINTSSTRSLYRHIVARNLTSPFPAAHDDFVQPNDDHFTYAFIEAIYHIDNDGADSHFYLENGNDANDNHVVFRRNVSIRSGDASGAVWWRGGNAHYATLNIWAEPASEAGYTVDSSTRTFVINTSSGNFCLGDIFYLATLGATPFNLQTGGSVTDSDILLSDPSWVNYATRDFRLQAGSASIGAAPALTTTSGTGSSTTSVTVVDAQWFHDGLGLTRGDTIYVGADNNLLITDINWTTNTITLSAPISYGDGESVGLAYSGAGPDRNAIEYGGAYLTAATISNAGTTYTVTPNGDARFVVFYVNGIPQEPDYDAPYQITSARTVTAKAYPLWPQSQVVFDATTGGSVALSTLNATTFIISP